MAVLTCWSVKGGSGTTVTAAGLALAAPRPSVLVDLGGDLPPTLGIDEPQGQGLSDWFGAGATPEAIAALTVDVHGTTTLVARGVGALDRRDERWSALAGWMAHDERLWVVDAGLRPPAPLLAGDGRRTRNLLVLRACYVNFWHAARAQPHPDGVVLVTEHGRTLRAGDLADAVPAPVVAEFAVDPKIARAIDSGTLASRFPTGAISQLSAAAVPPGDRTPANARRRPLATLGRRRRLAWR